MNCKLIAASDELWCAVRNYAESCSWKAGKALANAMDTHAFRDWERVVVALDNERICGYCTVVASPMFHIHLILVFYLLMRHIEEID